jgi:DNA-binding NarL/FixJ family response regulator
MRSEASMPILGGMRWIDEPDSTRVLLLDVAGFARTALADLVRATPGVELVGEAGADELESALLEADPDVLLVDDRLLAAAPLDTHVDPRRLIVLGVDDDPGYAARAQRAGAEAWIPKDRADSLLPLLLTEPADVGPRR